ncbi:hypothetical protein F2Q68_00034027 [Brassica cretica]|uniref:Uncharacterized protein n=1 Tax=Brassica cretica TaxID=69181 RepID=A0A8S9HB06_BRACR|nr:hypothetical protein F2Q68_00034027 [Brassica cretica]
MHIATEHRQDTGLLVPARRRPGSPLGSTTDRATQATPREAVLQKQLDGLQCQVTELNGAREEVVENPELSSEVQSLNENLDVHSKQLEHSAEKLTE